MSETTIGGFLGATRRESGDSAGRLARLLALAAAPTFAIMAVSTGFFGDSMPDTVCSATPPGLPLNGMVIMYALMSVFHASPWLAMLSRRRGNAGGQR